MARANDPDDELSSDDDELDSEERRPRRARRTPPARPAARRPPMRRWRSPDAEEESEVDEEPEAGGAAPKKWYQRDRKPVYWRARDSLFFEPLVAVAIIVVLLVGLYAYTQNWPPVYVVESGSMQHGPDDVLGVINAGDLVLAQKIPTDQITPYAVGVQTGYSTYGEYGDVLLYLPNGNGSTPIIHRAIVFLQYDAVTNRYNASELSGLRCGNESGAIYRTPGTPGDCGVTELDGTLDLYDIGWRSANVSLQLDSAELGRHSGFLTMGDNNTYPTGCTRNCNGLPDQQSGLSSLVEPGWVIGVARGMIPWVGAVKLLLEGKGGNVPTQSWQFLGLTIVGLILLAFGIHYALRAEGIEDERRKEEEAEQAEEEAAAEAERSDSRGRRFLRALRPWGRGDDEDEVGEEPPRPRPKARSTTRDHRRGRPAPKVRRDASAKSRAPARRDDDDAL